MSKDDCKELKNIKYQTMINNKYKESPIHTKQTDKDIDILLKTEREKNKKDLWNKLDKTDKIKKINEYITKTLKDELQLSQSEINELKTYMNNCIDKKRLKNSDVVYDKENGKIIKIPSLICNKLNRKFTLKREKRPSTLKSLAPKNNKAKTKTKRKSPISKED
tara:strand:+ start:396 stop:887 length:492 start_codon:yes stop_codon:yes gene_type:complete